MSVVKRWAYAAAAAAALVLLVVGAVAGAVKDRKIPSQRRCLSLVPNSNIWFTLYSSALYSPVLFPSTRILRFDTVLFIGRKQIRLLQEELPFPYMQFTNAHSHSSC